jgi:hypothetical protein
MARETTLGGRLRNYVSFSLLIGAKAFSKLFYRLAIRWVGAVPEDPWTGIRLITMLHHTSLYEPIFAAGAPDGLLWEIAKNGVVPVAKKTTDRPIVGWFFRLVAPNVVPVTRERDETWTELLRQIGNPEAVVVILPEGRMKRSSGLDSEGRPMTIRGGIADILQAIPSGRMLVVYSGGLHHVQAPGETIPRLFKNVRLRLEIIDIGTYRDALGEYANHSDFKAAVIGDLTRRRDLYCPAAAPLAHAMLPLPESPLPDPAPSNAEGESGP